MRKIIRINKVVMFLFMLTLPLVAFSACGKPVPNTVTSYVTVTSPAVITIPATTTMPPTITPPAINTTTSKSSPTQTPAVEPVITQSPTAMTITTSKSSPTQTPAMELVITQSPTAMTITTSKSSPTQTPIDVKKVPVKATSTGEWSVNTLPLNAHVQSVMAGDTAGNGQTRIVVGGAEGGHVYVFRWENGKYFQEWSSQVATNGYIMPAAIGDADNDGHPEFLLSSWQGGPPIYNSDGKIYMYGWDGAGYRLVLRQDMPQYSGLASIADLDGDGKNELILNTSTVGVYRYSARSGTFENLWSSLYRADLQISTGDVDGDGRVEAVATSSSLNGLMVIGYEDGKYVIEASLTDFPNRLGAACAADLDNDGTDEIVTSIFNVAADDFPIFIVEHDKIGYTINRIGTSDCGTFQIHAGDVDGDGVPEVNILKNNKDSYLVDGHDDYLMSLALLVEAVRQYTPREARGT